MKTLITASLMLISILASGQSTEDSVKQVVSQLFQSMKDADSAAVVGLFAPGAVIHSITPRGVRAETMEGFGSAIQRLKKGQLDERIRFGAVHIDAGLASVWTPYRLYFDGKFVHCGADSFQLIRFNGQWKIVYLIDTRRKDCEPEP